MYKIIALCGKSGAGKDSLMMATFSHLEKYLNPIISHTTRPKREKEIADKYFVVLMITPQNDEKDFERLEKWAVETKYKRVAKKKIEPKKLILHRAERVMSIRKAAFSPYRKIKVSDAGGSICASQTIACPPAIPIAVCGERIDQNMISIFEEYGIDYVNVVSY